MTSKGKKSVRPGFSKGRKPAFRSTEPRVTKSKEPKVDASPNKGAASPIQFFIADYNGGPTGKMVGYLPFDGDKCGFLDLPYDPRIRGLKGIEPKMRKPRQNTDPSVEVAVPVQEFDDFADAIKAMSRFLKPKDRKAMSRFLKPKDRNDVVDPSFQRWNLKDDSSDVEDYSSDVDVPFQLLNLEDDSRDDSTHSRILT